MRARTNFRERIVRSLLPLLTSLAAICGTALTEHLPAGWRTYRSSDYGFVIAYPPDFQFYSDLQGAPASYIPICGYESVTCIEYSGPQYEGTNFGAAGVTVNILRDRRTEEECKKVENSFPVRTTTLNGTRFYLGEIGEGGLGHAIGGPVYRVFREHVCIEIELLVTATDIGVYDPGTVKEFDSTKLENQLDAIVRSFRFVGHVVDGPGWNVHYNNTCGGIWEYPKAATVETAIEYSQERFYSDDITCEDHFIDHRRRYAVSAKVNLRRLGEVEKWLKGYGYPQLDETKQELNSTYARKYKAGPFYYVYRQTTLYILSVSDTHGKIISPEGDRVFRHFLNSFKAG